ncbi:retinoblastoma-like protein 2 [Cynoglossus semilaevis]|uniref:retinoblastoma-like protein 2 n=1 Tax=Cynoglossus semilaevis TaxID=244447 RepID=UPI000497EAF0|nr:retinoblastoma-like protein 2 [Cynoglossus semilaevis]XP_024911495.1 retinoblastoma-like protein 2 [Cynoglossus semilaevis]
MATMHHGPSDRLTAIFRSYTKDPTEQITERLKNMLHMFQLHYEDNSVDEKTKELVEKCCHEVPFWYYSILENLVLQEQKRKKDVSRTLGDDLFNSCLVTSCLEITMCTNHLSCDRLLQILKMESFYYLQVLSLVLQPGVTLSHSATHHLARTRVEVLVKLVWTKNSLLWKIIKDNKNQLPTCLQAMPPSECEDLNNTEVLTELCTNLAVDVPPRRNSLRRFARDVYALMSKRLLKLCSSLNICDEQRLKIWTCFEYSLVNCSEIMVDRNLDHLLMCAIYIITKVTKLEISLKCIREHYESIFEPSVCKDKLGTSAGNEETSTSGVEDHSSLFLTPITPSVDHKDNIFQFYNQVYVEKVETFANQFTSNSGSDTPPLSPFPRQMTHPHQQVLPRKTPLSVSLLTKTPPINNGRSFYINSSPREELNEINDMVRTGRQRPTCCYALPLDENLEDSPSAKRPRQKEGSALDKRLWSMAKDWKRNLNF